MDVFTASLRSACCHHSEHFVINLRPVTNGWPLMAN
ncbi:gluconate 5-dehydrogenase [Yersinia pekkanenii]